MRSRPVPNPRRGLMRAAAVVVGLLILSIAIVLLANALTPNTANAPVVPPTSPPVTLKPATLKPGTLKPGTARPTLPPSPRATTSKGKARATAKPTHAGALIPIPRPVQPVAIRSGAALVAAARHANRLTRTTAAFYLHGGNVYQGAPLVVVSGGVRRVVATGDPYVPPIWSPNHHIVLFVRVAPTNVFPGSRWSLLAYNLKTLRTTLLASHAALTLTPLGWAGGTLLYLVGRSTDTDLYTVQRGRPVLKTILMPQVITAAKLDPAGRTIAFSAPANCAVCTLDFFNLQNSRVEIGPSPLAGATAFAWDHKSDVAITAVGKDLLLMGVDAHVITKLHLPLGIQWDDPLSVSVMGKRVTIHDALTDRTVVAG